MYTVRKIADYSGTPCAIISHTRLVRKVPERRGIVCSNMEVKVARFAETTTHRGGGRPSTLDLRKPPWKSYRVPAQSVISR